MLIYKATNKINGKSYIGQTIGSLKKRRQKHISDASIKRYMLHFHNAIRKYGPNNFDWEVLIESNFTIELLNRLEIYFISLYNTYNNGYNLTLGGSGSVGYVASKETRKKLAKAHIDVKPSKETREKLSKAKKGMNNPNYGKKHNSKSLKRMSEAKKGKKHPFYGKRGKETPMYDKKHSVMSKKKMSESKKDKNNPSARAVMINGVYFDTIKEAAECLGVTPPTIRNRILKLHQGYQYADV